MKIKFKKVLLFFFIVFTILNIVKASYFEIFAFKPEDCVNVKEGYVTCTFKLISENSSLYFIESDEEIDTRIRTKSFLYDVGKNIWPSNPTYGAYIFIFILFGGLYLLYKKGTGR